MKGLGPLFLKGEKLKMVEEVKYLGVIFDSKVDWNQHLKRITQRANTVFETVRRTYGKKLGLRPSMIHWIYTRIIRPSITYELSFGGKKFFKTTPKSSYAEFKEQPAWL